ncbi:c-type cytochrome [Phenylobacterium montanum]|uniref:Cytochrome c n=1 Tax=Phenylobacterium montanum TaxID=2823693 RepID=A0A975G2B0_9CAUL|nr:cytochrome c [Caulobacter sp. S6]QUD89257.1 cytochrome c [Caulobacter sp. S6]
MKFVHGRPVGLVALAILAAGGGAAAQDFFGGHFSEQTGEAIFKGICQGCHMPDAKGAVGAGAYPALAGDERLSAAAYPALVITVGQKAMPSFGDQLSDEQIANVVNYIRSNFGNHYTDKITPDEVKAMRPPKAPG